MGGEAGNPGDRAQVCGAFEEAIESIAHDAVYRRHPWQFKTVPESPWHWGSVDIGEGDMLQSRQRVEEELQNGLVEFTPVDREPTAAFC